MNACLPCPRPTAASQPTNTNNTRVNTMRWQIEASTARAGVFDVCMMCVPQRPGQQVQGCVWQLDDQWPPRHGRQQSCAAAHLPHATSTGHANNRTRWRSVDLLQSHRHSQPLTCSRPSLSSLTTLTGTWPYMNPVPAPAMCSPICGGRTAAHGRQAVGNWTHKKTPDRSNSLSPSLPFAHQSHAAAWT